MSLQKTIIHWDGKSASYISEVYDGYAHEKNFPEQLVSLIADAESQKGASWLLKKHLESEGTITPALTIDIYRLLPLLNEWETKLHILQSIPYLPIAHVVKAEVGSFLRSCLSEKNKFVRAWAYNGLHEIANQHPEFREEVNQLLRAGMEEEAASVRARIRNIMK